MQFPYVPGNYAQSKTRCKTSAFYRWHFILNKLFASLHTRVFYSVRKIPLIERGGTNL